MASCQNGNEKQIQNEAKAETNEQMPSFSETFHTEQIVLVIAPNETSITAEMQLLNWDKSQNKWIKAVPAFPVTLGRTGMSWGKGLHPSEWNMAPMKKEGDGKAPQGIFGISSFFGYKAQNELPFEPKLPYLQAKNNTFCVDDVNSSFYNKITDDSKKDWNSAENMLRTDNLYELGAVVDYNTQNIEKGAGSCVFIHIWRAADKATAGCTAMQKDKIIAVFSQLDAKNHPVLVQMTQANAQKYLGEMGE